MSFMTQKRITEKKKLVSSYYQWINRLTLLLFTIFMSHGLAHGATSLFFPSIYDGVDEWKNYISVQAENSNDTVNIKVSFYNPDGLLAKPDLTLCPTCTNPVSFTILPFKKYNITPNWALYETNQHQLFEGTVVVTAEGPIIGLVSSYGPYQEAFNIHEADLAVVSAGRRLDG